MKIPLKMFFLVCGLLIAATLTIKIYFIPSVDRYLELSVKDQMERDMKAFENIIFVVVSAAGGQHDFVRRALTAITQNQNIPIVLRRSEIIDAQFGKVPERGPINAFERQVATSGEPYFHKKGGYFEYIYPLKAQPVCGNCHVNATGQAIAHGQVLGLAVKQMPTAALKESSLTFFVMDVFWHNLLMVGIMLGVAFLFLSHWIFKPLHRLVGKMEQGLWQRHVQDDQVPDELPDDEWALLEEGVAYLLSNGENEQHPT